MKNKSRFAQLIDLTWRAGMYRHENSDQVMLREVYELYSIMFHEDFNAQRGNVHTMYKGGNYQALADELQQAVHTQQSLMEEIAEQIHQVHEEKNP